MWAFLIALPALSRCVTPLGSYMHHMTLPTMLLQLACVLLLGIMVYLVAKTALELAEGWAMRLAPYLACAALGAAVWRLSMHHAMAHEGADQLKEWWPWSVGGMTVVMLISTWYSRRCGWSAAQWTSWTAQATLFLSPMMPLFWFHTLTRPFPIPAPAWEITAPAGEITAPAGELNQDDTTGTASRSPGSYDQGDHDQGDKLGHVFIVVLDAFPTRVALDDGAPRATLKNLRAFHETAWSFHNARSPTINTLTSMPGLIYQTGDRYGFSGYEPGFMMHRNQRFRPAHQTSNIFTEARRQGYRTVMLGSHHAYHVMLGTSVDHVRSTSYHDWLGDRAWQNAVEFYSAAATDFCGPVFSKHVLRTWQLQKNCAMFRQTNVLLQATHQLVGDLGQPTFAVIHLPLPHFPFCFDASGPRPARAVYAKDSEELLLGHLDYTDRVIGRMLQHLAEVGQFDNSTIVITSDHNWRNDPQLSGADDDALTHVPLWIKLPDQRRPYDSTQRVTTTRLMALLRLLGSQGGDAVTVHATLQQDASFGQPPIVDERDLRFTSG